MICAGCGVLRCCSITTVSSFALALVHPPTLIMALWGDRVTATVRALGRNLWSGAGGRGDGVAERRGIRHHRFLSCKWLLLLSPYS